MSIHIILSPGLSEKSRDSRTIGGVLLFKSVKRVGPVLPPPPTKSSSTRIHILQQLLSMSQDNDNKPEDQLEGSDEPPAAQAGKSLAPFVRVFAVIRLRRPSDAEEDKAGPSTAPQPEKRGRGRPKGSKNKRAGEGPPSKVAETGEKRKRGRPRKVWPPRCPYLAH